MKAIVTGIGTALPQHVASQAQLASMAVPYSCETPEHDRLLPVLYRRTSVKSRGSVLLRSSAKRGPALSMFYPPPGEPGDDRGAEVPRAAPGHGPTTAHRMQRYVDEAGPLVLRAARVALDEAATRPGEVTHLVMVTCTGFASPGVDQHVIEALGLPRSVQRVQVGFMGCHGAINGLRVAQALAQAGGCVLLCAVELCTLHFHYGWDPQKIVANALFADGAAAALIRPHSTSHGSSVIDAPQLELRQTGSYLIPESADAMTWRIGNHGFEMTLAPRVPDLIESHLRPWFEPWLASQGLEVGDVAHWVVHPGGPRVLTATVAALGLSSHAVSDSRAVLAEMGNMSSPTVLFILERMRRLGPLTGPCVLMGFGPGLAAEAALLIPQAG